jgi:hypothetical protein
VIAGPGVDSTYATGLSDDPATGTLYVDHRTFIGVYDDESGAALLDEGAPLKIGAGSLEDGYDVEVSTYPGTLGRLYVPDAATHTIKVYDPAVSATTPIDEIDGSATPPGRFNSLREASIAIDRVTGEIYITDDLQPKYTELSRTLVDVFNPDGSYRGHLKYFVFNSQPVGLAVDNSEQAGTQGRVYATSGNTELATIYGYPAGAATTDPPLSHGKALKMAVAGGGDGVLRTVVAPDGCGLQSCGIECPPTCEFSYPAGWTVSLAAEPRQGSVFSGWSGACAGTDPECTVTMDDAASAIARFEEAPGPPPSPDLRIQLPSSAGGDAPTTGASPALAGAGRRLKPHRHHRRHRRPRHKVGPRGPDAASRR